MPLNKDQQYAEEGLVDWFFYGSSNLACLSGSGGTGKTYLLKSLVKKIQDLRDFDVQIGAANSYADIRVTATNNDPVSGLVAEGFKDAITIYSALGLKLVTDYKTGIDKITPGTSHSTRMADLRIHIDLLIIDEASFLTEYLFKLIKPLGIKVLFVGDKNQLKAVGEKFSVFQKGLPTWNLTINERATSHTLKQMNLDLIKSVETKEYIPIKHNGVDIFVVDNYTYQRAISEVFIPGNEVDNEKVLCYTNQGMHDYNAHIRQHLELPVHPEVGDVIIANKYLKLPKVSSSQRINVTNIHTEAIPTDVSFANTVPFPTALLDPGDFQNYIEYALTPSDINTHAKNLAPNWGAIKDIRESILEYRFPYAETIHRSQGRTYSTVFLDLPSIFAVGGKMTLEDMLRLQYVGASRTAERLIVRSLNNKIGE